MSIVKLPRYKGKQGSRQQRDGVFEKASGTSAGSSCVRSLKSEFCDRRWPGFGENAQLRLWQLLRELHHRDTVTRRFVEVPRNGVSPEHVEAD